MSTNDNKRARLEAMQVVLSRFHDDDDEDEDVVGRSDPRLVVRARSILEVDRRPEAGAAPSGAAGAAADGSPPP